VFGIGYDIPVLWLLQIGFTVISYIMNICGWEVFVLSNAVTLGLSLTVQRSISTVAVAYLNTPPWPPWEMWFGLVNVFVGAAAYAVAPTVAHASDKKK